jgi:hypothetical protein
VLAFLITTPYALLDYQRFLVGINSERKHLAKGHYGQITAWSQVWMYHYTRSLIPGISLPVVILAGIGAVNLSGAKLTKLFPLVMFLLVFLPAEFVTSKPAPQPERYIVPALPFVAILAAMGISALSSFRLKIVAVSVCIVMLSFNLYRVDNSIQTDSRLVIKHYLETKLPPNARIISDHSRYGPPPLSHSQKLVTFPDKELFERLNPKQLSESGADYLVLSSLKYDRFFSEPSGTPMQRSIIRKVFKTYPIVKCIGGDVVYGFHNPRLCLFDLKNKASEQLTYQRQLLNSLPRRRNLVGRWLYSGTT